MTQLTACKFIGSPSGDHGGLLYTQDDLPPLAHRQFWVQWPRLNGVGRVQTRSELADYRHSVSDEEWWDYERRMIATYYVEASEAGTAAAATAEYIDEGRVHFTPDDDELPGYDPDNEPEAQPVQVPKPTSGRRRPPKR